MLTISELADQLNTLGIETGDHVMVHVSLRALGPVDRRAEGVVRALDRAIGVSGTAMMVLGAQDSWSWVNERPEEGRESLLSWAPPFDPLHAPAEQDVGVLAEVFRQCPGTMVSDHPEGRFAARGALADELLRDVPWDDYYGPGSPLERLVRTGGKVLRLGADPNTVTLLHYAEYLANVPGKRRVRRHRVVLHEGVRVIRTVDCLDDSHGIVDYAEEDYFAAILRSYLSQRVARVGQVGQARSELIDAGDLVAFGVRWMEEHLSVVRR